jgi:hypothetical protein
MPRYARINASDVVDALREYPSQPSDLPQKGWRWLPCPAVAPPSFDPTLEIVEGPTYVVGASEVAETWVKRNMTAPELDAAKDTAMNGLNGTFKVQRKALLQITNDIRDLRAKVNAVIDATAISGTVTKFPAGQTTQINMTQLINALKALL